MSADSDKLNKAKQDLIEVKRALEAKHTENEKKEPENQKLVAEAKAAMENADTSLKTQIYLRVEAIGKIEKHYKRGDFTPQIQGELMAQVKKEAGITS